MVPIAAGLLVLGPKEGRAASQEEFGLGSKGASMASAMTTIADDYSSSFYNPAGSTLAKQRGVCLGFTLTGQRIEATGYGPQGQDDLGIFFGMSFPLPFGGSLADRLYLATALIFPTGDTRFARIALSSPDTPFILPYTSAAERIVAAPALGIRLFDWLSIGAGVNLTTFETVNDAASTLGVLGIPEMAGNLYLKTNLAPRAGILIQPGKLLEGVPDARVGLTYRAASDQPFSLDSSLLIMGLAVDLEILGHEMFAPEEIVMGASMEAIENLTLSLDLAWERWSEFPSPRMTVMLGGLDQVVPLPQLSQIYAVPGDPDLGDTFSPRVGAELKGVDTVLGPLTFRAGYRFEPSPGPADASDPLLFTNARHVVATGLAFSPPIGWLDRAGLHPSIELHVQGQFLESESREVPPELSKSGLTDTVTAGGEAVSGGVTLLLGF